MNTNLKYFKHDIVTQNLKDIINEFDYYFDKTKDLGKQFGGPSIYFHVECINEQQTNWLSKRHLELIYATLTSWGMHRMGDPKITKTKLVDFDEFSNSILRHERFFNTWNSTSIDKLNEYDYSSFLDDLEEIFIDMSISVSNTIMVANSKTLCHILPNLLPPVDRQYTVRFLRYKKENYRTKNGSFRVITLPLGAKNQFGMFREICMICKHMVQRIPLGQMHVDKRSFNSSVPKVFDSLVIAYVRNAKEG